MSNNVYALGWIILSAITIGILIVINWFVDNWIFRITTIVLAIFVLFMVYFIGLTQKQYPNKTNYGGSINYFENNTEPMAITSIVPGNSGSILLQIPRVDKDNTKSDFH